MTTAPLRTYPTYPKCPKYTLMALPGSLRGHVGHIGHMGHVQRGGVMAFDATIFLADLFGLIPQLSPERLSEDLRYAFEERAGIKEFCGNLPRSEAERQAWFEVVGK